MHTFSHKPKATQQIASAKSTTPGRRHLEQRHEVGSILRLQRTIGNQALQRMLQTHAGESKSNLTGNESFCLEHDSSRIAMQPLAAGAAQTKLAINNPGDSYEREADRIADQVMAPQPDREHESLEARRVPAGEPGRIAAASIAHDVLRSSGQPLDSPTRAFMEPRFGYDFSGVRVHLGAAAEQSALDMNAHAYTIGHEIVFGAGRFNPATQEGRRLLGHELAHVVQQSGSDGIRSDATSEKRALSPVSLTSPVQIQREEIEMEGIDFHPKGLAMGKRVKDVSRRWVNLWRSKKDSTIRMLLGEMFNILNAELGTLRVAPVEFDPTPSTTEGGFRRQEWRVQTNLDIKLGRKVGFDSKASTLSADELAEIGDTLYHEGRHAEQAFLTARKHATTIVDPIVLAKTLDIPVRVAKAAILAGRPGRNDPGDEIIGEWSEFDPSGRYFAYWQWNEAMKVVTAATLEPIVSRSPRTPDEYRSLAELINMKINLLSTKWSLPYEEIARIEKLSAPDTIDTDVLAQLRRITSAFDKLVRAIDDFRTAVSLLQRVASNPDERDLQMLDATSKWLDVHAAQLELHIAQGEAYRAYPVEVDARRAGIAAKESILAATRPSRAR